MTLYALVLFVHVSAVLVLFAALGIEVLSLYRLRRASTVTEVLAWMEPVPRQALIGAISGPVTLLSGVYLAMRMSAFGLAWLWVALAALVLMAPLGAATGRRIRAIRRDCAEATAITSDMLIRLQDPFLRISLGARISMFLAIVLLMVAKPNLWESVSIVGSFMLFGAVMSLLGGRRGTLSAPRTQLGR